MIQKYVEPHVAVVQEEEGLSLKGTGALFLRHRE